MTDWLDELLPEGTPSGQRRAVTEDEALITVGAGAGTGKTWVLSARFARLLLSDRTCLPQNILTLTFTEAAAREMQERIKTRALDLITRSGRGGYGNAERRAVVDGFDEAWISTIHSFASRLIRESGLALDIDPQSGVVSAPQEEAFWGAFERALESLDLSSSASLYGRALTAEASRLEGDGALLAALEKWRPSVLRDLARGVTELFASLGHDRETLLTWADEAERAIGARTPDPRTAAASVSLLEVLRPRWEEAWRLWCGLFAAARSAIREEREKVLRKETKKETKTESPVLYLASLLERWGEAVERAPSLEDLRTFYSDVCSPRTSSANSNFYKALREHFGGLSVSEWRKSQERWRDLSASLEAPLSEAEQRLRAALLRLSAFAWGAWDEMKRRRGLLSFTDMIRFAAESVRADERPKGFRHVLVDEFQDTDPLQDALIRALKEKEGAKLFLVGDPKQAIYRFRHADLTLFADYMLRAREAGSAVDLNVSFRTRAALLEPVNSLFARIWKDGLGAGERMSRLKFEPLSAPTAFAPKASASERDLASVAPFSQLLSVKKGRGDKGAHARLADALAATFARWTEEGRTVWDKGERRLRPVRWRDFAVLVPSRSKYEVLETAFEAAGIPAAFERSMSYFSRGEVTDVVNVLRAAAFPRDETALAGWLSSPFSGARQREAEECFKAHAAAVRRSPGTSLRSVLRERLPAVEERLQALERLGSLRGPSAVLTWLLEDRTWLASFGAAQRLRVVGNLNRAAAVARQYESGVSPSLAGCAQWLDTALRADRALEEPEWMDEDADAVHVTTVHASKGLEYPVVAVFHMERGVGNKRSDSVLPSKSMGVAFSAIPDMISSEADEIPEPRSLLWERALSAQGELEESARLFYVAATRAQDALILCGTLSENKDGLRVKADSWLDWTLSWLGGENEGGWRELRDPRIVYVDEKIGEEGAAPLQGEGRALEEPPCEAPSRPLPLPTTDGVVLSSLSATSFALFEWCPFAWRRRHRQGLDLRWETPEDGEDAVGGSQLGSVAHWILARWDMKEETLGEWLDRDGVARRLPAPLRDAWREAENREALRNWLTAFACSDEGRKLAEAGGALRREGAFCVTLFDSGNDEGLRLVGATDALWRDERGGWHVRDYKITLSDVAPGELYRAQLAFYALAVRLLAERQGLPFEGVDVGLIFLREGGKLGDSRHFPRGADWATMSGQLLDAARTAARGPWIPRRDHCRQCPWRKNCPKRS